MIPLVDDIVPYISINGQEFMLDTLAEYWYSPRIHFVEPVLLIIASLSV
jgi:hypothetical protein